ncbi:acyl carrier protein [Pseudonocardia broussonetiae]|uniref:Carrier domain-containing protein n=1 Tax=Pseudonocardia broussonetiae TaxID=2736640 RepID=A0A6M6JH60_9PSEU|nr:phosphopantetheine-binding protein [Pseudonocardia broussonetiae]QJY45731.1 hypothetical protein HOP40_07905 [Pseudonocardia broussonetiae]
MTVRPIEHEQIAGQIEAFVREVGRIAPDDRGFDRDVDLFESGYLDSLGVIRLIEFVESTFLLVLADEDLFGRNFTTVDGIAGILVRARQQSGPVS